MIQTTFRDEKKEETYNCKVKKFFNLHLNLQPKCNELIVTKNCQNVGVKGKQRFPTF